MSASAALSHEAPPGFRIGPLGTYADPQDMQRWLDVAAPGDTITYATSPALGEKEAAKLARRWADAGQVELFQRRATRAHCFDYCARRVATGSSRPAASQPEDGGTAATGGGDTRSQMRALLQILRRCAVRGAACPSNAKLAIEIGLGRGPRGRRRAQYLFERLQAEGRIAATGCGRNAPRVVTVLVAGKGCGQSTSGDVE